MVQAPLPKNEKKRLDALLKLNLLDSPAEEEFDELVQLASNISRMPIALITLVDADRQWFKARVGISIDETSREVAFCAYTILGDDLLEIPDTLKDERFSSNPLVKEGPKVRFYAGVPLLTSSGYALGSLCVLGLKPGKLDKEQQFALRVLARQVVSRIEYTYHKRELNEIQRQLQKREPQVLDSLRYGELIHKKLMPQRPLLKEFFQESFILWKPRDLIPNNFCLLKKKGNDLFIGVVDCMDQCAVDPFFGTLVNDYLNQVIEQDIYSTAQILRELEMRFRHMWTNKRRLAENGISIALCRVDADRKMLLFSAANQLMLCVNRSNGFNFLRGSRFRLGRKEQDENTFSYREENIRIEEGTTFYLPGQDVQALLMAVGKEGLKEEIEESFIGQETSMNNQYAKILQLLNKLSPKREQKKPDLHIAGFKA